MRRLLFAALALSVATAVMFSMPQDATSQDPARTGKKKRRPSQDQNTDGVASTSRKKRETNNSTQPQPSPSNTMTQKAPKEPKQQRQRSEQDAFARNRRAQQELEERTTVFSNTATKTYYRQRCDPESAELLMMNLSEAKKAGFRGAKCPKP